MASEKNTKQEVLPDEVIAARFRKLQRSKFRRVQPSSYPRYDR